MNGTPLPHEEPQEVNPPSGMVVYYSLKAPAAKPLKLELVDGSGAVRSCAASDTPMREVDTETLNVQAYWEVPVPPPSRQPGCTGSRWARRQAEVAEAAGAAPLLQLWWMPVHSLCSHNIWNRSQLAVEVTFFSDDASSTEPETLRHVSHPDHFRVHEDWLQRDQKLSIRTGGDLVALAPALYPNVELGIDDKRKSPACLVPSAISAGSSNVWNPRTAKSSPGPTVRSATITFQAPLLARAKAFAVPRRE